MLTDHERTTLREMQHHLTDDPGFEHFFRRRVAPPRGRLRRALHATLITCAALIAAVLMLTGSFGVAALFTAAAVAFGLAAHLEHRTRGHKHDE